MLWAFTFQLCVPERLIRETGKPWPATQTCTCSCPSPDWRESSYHPFGGRIQGVPHWIWASHGTYTFSFSTTYAGVCVALLVPPCPAGSLGPHPGLAIWMPIQQLVNEAASSSLLCPPSSPSRPVRFSYPSLSPPSHTTVFLLS